MDEVVARQLSQDMATGLMNIYGGSVKPWEFEQTEKLFYFYQLRNDG